MTPTTPSMLSTFSKPAIVNSVAALPSPAIKAEEVLGAVLTRMGEKNYESPCEQLSRYLSHYPQDFNRGLLSHSFTCHMKERSVKCVHYEPIGVSSMATLDKDMRVDPNAATPESHFYGGVSIEKDTVKGVHPSGRPEAFKIPG